ncbi:MAG: DUF3574 domain-containing protein [Acidobacteriota bacterium]
MKKSFLTSFALIIMFSLSGIAFASDPSSTPLEHPASARKNTSINKAMRECLIRNKELFTVGEPSSSAAATTQSTFTGFSFARTELYFGSAKPDGTVVTEAQFQQFVDQVVTPRFPDGLTLLVGLGQFRDSSGTIIKERSMLLILLYPASAQSSSSPKIEEIREAYKQQFQQESVLRSDRCCEMVGF